ncbi:MAG: DNA-binding transcriptional regulator YciT [Rouxiella badensis]|uniref:DeoR family transcriptional regulator n=1 Tax=Rouxiella badensis TaxID=1646377 RepID=UPI003C3E8962
MNTRQQQILEIVNQRKSVSVSELAQLCSVSEVTVRQDLNALESQHYLKRVHGSAVSTESDNLDQRMQTNFLTKKLIAEFAASLVEDGESVFIEGGSTNALLARTLAERGNVTLITVSYYIANLLKDTECDVIILGGFYQKGSQSVVGPLTRSGIQQVHFSKAFIGIDGFHDSTGFTGRDMMRSDVVNAILAKSTETIVLTDSSKFGSIQPYPLSEQYPISRVITDAELPAEYQHKLEAMGIALNIVNL